MHTPILDSIHTFGTLNIYGYKDAVRQGEIAQRVSKAA
jgi:hypothetical protein